MEYPPHEHAPFDDGVAKEPQGDPTPPPSRPPTAVEASGQEPRPPVPVRRWEGGGRRAGAPNALLRAMDQVLDVLDAVADAVRAAAGRAAR